MVTHLAGLFALMVEAGGFFGADYATRRGDGWFAEECGEDCGLQPLSAALADVTIHFE